MTTPLISIITPVWNGASYIKRFIDSMTILFNDEKIEIIVIDDGSSDNTSEILNNHTKGVSNFRLITTENGGQGKARNIGIDSACGTYLAFVDADDSLSCSFLQTILPVVKSQEIDLVIFGHQAVSEHYPHNVISTHLPTTEYTYCAPSALDNFHSLGHSAWNKVIRKDYLTKNSLYFAEGRIYEDLSVVPFWISRAHQVVLLPEAIYLYTIRTGSSVNQFNESAFSIIPALKELSSNAKKNETQRIWKSIFREIFFYSLPNHSPHLLDHSKSKSYRQLHRELVKFYKEFLDQHGKSLNYKGIPLTHRMYASLTSKNMFVLPLLLNGLRQIRNWRKS